MNKHLSYEERIKIETLLEQKIKPYKIARILNRSTQTIYNEIKRGSVTQIDTHLRSYNVYKSDYAQNIHDINMSHCGVDLKVGSDFSFLDLVQKIIKEKSYSPYAALQYIRLNNLYSGTTLCVNSIYNYVQKGLFKDLTYKDLPSGSRKAKKKNTAVRLSWKNKRGKSISERPAEASGRECIGHWEGDTVVSGSGDTSCLLVLTERFSRKEIIKKIPNRQTQTINKCFKRIHFELAKADLLDSIKSITFDNGVEFSGWSNIEKLFNINVYFAHPYRSCERGSNENQNRLIRRFIPKGSKISEYTDYDINNIEQWINDLPRKILGGISSNMAFNQCFL